MNNQTTVPSVRHRLTELRKAHTDAESFHQITDDIMKQQHLENIPPTWKIHPVFYARLPTPYIQTHKHGPSATYTPPDIINDEE